jgi:hypothetical protein
MKTKISTIILLLILNLTTYMAQTSNEKPAVEETIKKFAKSADERNEKKLDELLNTNFRLALNQLFGSKEVVIIDKQTYLNKIRAKEFGGDNRSVLVEDLLVFGNNAMAKATFRGDKMTIVTLLQLVRSTEGKWQIINDLPSIP